MRKIYTSPDQFLIKLLRSQLQSHGISCHLKNDILSGAIGELPPLEAWLELWLKDESDVKRAAEIIKPLINSTKGGIQDVPCVNCREMNPSNFELCWNCGQEMLPV